MSQLNDAAISEALGAMSEVDTARKRLVAALEELQTLHRQKEACRGPLDHAAGDFVCSGMRRDDGVSIRVATISYTELNEALHARVGKAREAFKVATERALGKKSC